MNKGRSKGLKSLIELARSSGIPYSQIQKRAGIGGDSTISHWQVGRYGASLFNAECVAEVLGFELQWVQKGTGDTIERLQSELEVAKFDLAAKSGIDHATIARLERALSAARCPVVCEWRTRAEEAEAARNSKD